MQKKEILCLFVIAVLAACRPVKPVQQKIETVIAKKDTAIITPTIIIPKVDSNAIVKEIMDKVLLRRINFSTFDAKVKVDYDDAEESQTVTAYIKIKADSVINIRLTHPLAGLVFELQVYKDSLIMLNHRKNIIQYRKLSYLQEITNIPFDFNTLQDLIVGNPVFLNDKVVSYRNTGDKLLVLLTGDIFKHLVTLDNNDFKVLHSKLDDVDVMRNRTCDITLSDYRVQDGYLFSNNREIAISEKSKLDIRIDFKKATFNQPLILTFNIPKKYKIG